MKFKIAIMFFMLYLNPNLSRSNEVMLGECIKYFDLSGLDILKKIVVEKSSIVNVNFISKINFKFDDYPNSAIAYTSYSNKNWNIYFNKNIFKFFCKKQIDLNLLKNIIKSEGKLTKGNSYKVFSDYKNYWSSCVLSGLSGKVCEFFYKIDVKKQYLNLDKSNYKNIYSNNIDDLKKNVLNTLLFISFHEVAHMIKNHSIFHSEKEKINMEFEADNFAFEKILINHIDFELIYYDVAMLPIFFFKEKSTVEKIKYNSINIKDVNLCRANRISDYIYILSVYDRILSISVHQKISKNKLFIGEKRIEKFKKVVAKYTKYSMKICGDETNFISPYNSGKVLEAINNFKKFIEISKKKSFKKAIENLEIKNKDSIVDVIYMKNLIRLLIVDNFHKNKIIPYESTSKIEMLLQYSIKKLSQEDVKLLITYLCNGILYNRNIPIIKRIKKIKKYTSISIKYKLNQPSTYFHLATLEVIKGAFSKAEKYYEKSISLDYDEKSRKTTKMLYSFLKEDSEKFRKSTIRILNSI